MQNKKAFTLVELMIVIGILAILVTIGVQNYAGTLKDARDARRKADLESIRQQLEVYHQAIGQYPASLSSLEADNAPYSFNGFRIPKDPKPPQPKYDSKNYYVDNAGATYAVGVALERGKNGNGKCSVSVDLGNNGIAATCKDSTTANCVYCIDQYGEITP